jgi:hypothetical protein
MVLYLLDIFSPEACTAAVYKHGVWLVAYSLYAATHSIETLARHLSEASRRQLWSWMFQIQSACLIERFIDKRVVAANVHKRVLATNIPSTH